MNIIINGFHDKEISKIALAVIKKFNVASCHIIYDGYKIKVPEKTNPIFHAWDDLNWSANYQIDWNSLKPLDEELIEKMSDCERVFMKMADRLESRRHYAYAERKWLYLQHLRYWNHVLKTEKIDLFLSSNIPHETFDFIIYCLCKLNNIPTILFDQTKIDDAVLLIEDWEKSDPRIESEYQALSRTQDKAKESEIELTGKFKECFENQITGATIPFYMGENKFSLQLSNLARRNWLYLRDVFRQKPAFLANRVLNARFWQKKVIFRLRALLRYLNDQRLNKEYNSLAVLPDLNQKYIFVPLHYQPEMNSCPLGGAYVDQILLINLLSAALPDNMLIYVKEHPNQRAIGRENNYYQILAAMPKVRLIKKNFSTKIIIQNSLALATLTGTAGFEALFQGKPVMLFGHTFYQYAPGVLSIRTEDDAKKAINQILRHNISPNQKEIKNFLLAIAKVAIQGYIDPCYAQVSNISPQENIANLSEALIKKIKSLKITT